MISLYAALAVLFACWVSMVWLAASYHRLLEETLNTLRQERGRRELLERANRIRAELLFEAVRQNTTARGAEAADVKPGRSAPPTNTNGVL